MAMTYPPYQDRLAQSMAEEIKGLVKREVTNLTDAMEQRLQQIEDRGAIGPQDVRMSVLHLVMGSKEQFHAPGDVIDRVDSLVRYVLTGKKSGEE